MPNDDDIIAIRNHAYEIYDDIQDLQSYGFSILGSPVNPYCYADDASALRSSIAYNSKLILIYRKDGCVVTISPGDDEIMVSRIHYRPIQIPRQAINGQEDIYDSIQKYIPTEWKNHEKE